MRNPGRADAKPQHQQSAQKFLSHRRYTGVDHEPQENRSSGHVPPGFITDAQYQESHSQTLVVQETSNHNEMYNMPYFVEYAIDDVNTNFLEVRNCRIPSKTAAPLKTNCVTGGYHIYNHSRPGYPKYRTRIPSPNWTAIHPWPTRQIPSPKTRTATEPTRKPSSRKRQPSCWITIRAELKAIVGGRYTPTAKKTFNRASDSAMMVAPP
jgi:hypothetical protein